MQRPKSIVASIRAALLVSLLLLPLGILFLANKAVAHEGKPHNWFTCHDDEVDGHSHVWKDGRCQDGSGGGFGARRCGANKYWSKKLKRCIDRRKTR